MYRLHPNESLKGFVWFDISFKDFLLQTKELLVAKHSFTAEEAEEFVNETTNCWEDYYTNGYTVTEAIEEDLQFWDSVEFEVDFEPFFLEDEDTDTGG